MNAIITVAMALLAPLASASPHVNAYSSGYDVGIARGHQASLTPTSIPSTHGAVHAVASFAYRPACGTSFATGEGQPVCPQNICPDGQSMFRLWQVAPPPAHPLQLVCSGSGAPAAVPLPQVTPGMVLNAFRRVPLPHLRSHTQPADKTLINFDTIFYTQAQPLTRTVRLLGQQVRLEIRPARFEWVHGDGTSATTSSPGAPYPSKDVVHRYAHAHTTVDHRVVVTWTAEYAVNGGPLQPVPGTVTTAGPATPLRVAEASPALSGEGH